MGVLRLFRHISLKWEDCLEKLKGAIDACETAHSKGIKVDWLELDLNSIFHPVAQELYQYGNTPKNSLPASLLYPSRNKPRQQPQIPEKKLFADICKRIEAIRRIIEPELGIYFATDGVAGSSKGSQQRKRRFKAAQEAEAKSSSSHGEHNVLPKWDSNCISTGTSFMERLGLYIDAWVKRQMHENPAWKNLTVIVDSHRLVGEGEHKLLKHMRQNPQCSYVIVSPDADLIFLGMGAHNPRVWIFRENIFDDIDASFFLVDLSLFRQCVLKEIGMDEEKSRADLRVKYSLTDKEIVEKIIEDFIIYCFFIGNDFLPQIPSLNINNDGIETILTIYPKVIREHGFITVKENGTYNISKSSLKSLLYELAQLEYQMMVTHQKQSRARWPDTILQKHVSHPIVPGKFKDSGQPERTLAIDMPRYKQEYYEQKFGGIEPESIVHEYLKGMVFVLRYYLDTIPSYTWSFPFNFAPFFQEMYEHVDSFDTSMTFEPSTPLSPLEQLTAVLPGRSSYLLPEALQMLSTSSKSPIIDMYPIDFEVDLEGKRQEYEGVVILPHISVDRLRKAFKALEPQLSEYDRERNLPGKLVTYFRNNEGQVIQRITDPKQI